MLNCLKQLFCKHRWTLAMSDPDGEFDIGDNTYSGNVDLYACVDCGKVKAKIKWNDEYPIGHPKYKLDNVDEW